MDFVPGALVAGRYRLKRMVGSGGMGEVWLADDTTSGVKVALKHLLPAAAKHHEVIARFKREAYLLGKVQSDYIAKVVDFFDDDSFGLVLVMEFIDGPSLAHILEDRVLSVEEAIDLAVDLLRALTKLHASNIVHRDLKPGNIIMRPMKSAGPRAVVVDFGISRLIPTGDEEVTGITRANIALGTVEYMAPEQILNSRDVTHVTDLYAVGIILFRAVKGHHAFGDRRGEELARAKLIEDAPALDCGREDEVAKGLVAVVARALKKKPALRYRNASEMLEEVEGLQRTAQLIADLDDSTTDGGATAVKLSPLATSRVEPPAPPRPAAGAPARPPAPRPSAPPPPPRSEVSSPAASGRPPLHSVPEAAPIGRASIPEIRTSDPRASDPRASDPRASMSSISDVAGLQAGAAAPSSPRSSLASIDANGQSGSFAAVVPPPPPSELTSEHKGGVFLSKATLGLAVLTAFAVGAAVGLVIAPASVPPATASAKVDPTCTAAATEAPKASAPPASDSTSAAATASQTPSASATVSSAPTASATASAAKPVLTGKVPTAKPTATTPPDGLGEDDPPPKPTATSTPTAAPTATATATAPPTPPPGDAPL